LAFKAWASREACPGIRPVLGLFTTLLDKGFKVFLLSGRDEETLGSCTAANLEAEGFSGYERLIMRCSADNFPSTWFYLILAEPSVKHVVRR
jgi:hypothetical protein